MSLLQLQIIKPPHTTSNKKPPPRAGFLLNQYYDCLIGTYPMSEEQLKAFLEKVKDDSSLQEKLKGVSDANAVAAIAKEAGFSVSADELTKAPSELSDEELEGVVGGCVNHKSIIRLTAAPLNNISIIDTKPSDNGSSDRIHI